MKPRYVFSFTRGAIAEGCRILNPSVDMLAKLVEMHDFSHEPYLLQARTKEKCSELDQCFLADIPATIEIAAAAPASPSPASGRGQEETARRMDYASLGVPLPFIAHDLSKTGHHFSGSCVPEANLKELLPELGCETDCTAGFAFVCRSMIEPKAGPTAGSGVTRWCSAESFDALYGITRARSASRERISMFTSPPWGEVASVASG